MGMVSCNILCLYICKFCCLVGCLNNLNIPVLFVFNESILSVLLYCNRIT